MRVESTPKKNTTVASVLTLPVGTVFYVDKDPNGLQGRVLLRTYDGLVDLENPNSTWIYPRFGIESIKIYPNAKIVLGDPE